MKVLEHLKTSTKYDSNVNMSPWFFSIPSPWVSSGGPGQWMLGNLTHPGQPVDHGEQFLHVLTLLQSFLQYKKSKSQVTLDLTFIQFQQNPPTFLSQRDFQHNPPHNFKIPTVLHFNLSISVSIHCQQLPSSSSLHPGQRALSAYVPASHGGPGIWLRSGPGTPTHPLSALPPCNEAVHTSCDKHWSSWETKRKGKLHEWKVKATDFGKSMWRLRQQNNKSRDESIFFSIVCAHTYVCVRDRTGQGCTREENRTRVLPLSAHSLKQ